MSLNVSNSTVLDARTPSIAAPRTRFTERMLAKFVPTKDYFPWASIAALLTAVVFSVTMFSMLLNPSDYNLFAKVYFTVGFVINFAGLHCIRSGAEYQYVATYFVLYIALFSGLIYQAFESTFLVGDQMKAYLMKQCLLQFEKVTENDCAGLATGQANSEILTYVFLILVMAVFTYWIGLFLYNTKNPAVPEYEEEFGKYEGGEEFELPLYDAGYTIPPPVYHNADSIEVAVGDAPYTRSPSLDHGILEFLAPNAESNDEDAITIPEQAARSTV